MANPDHILTDLSKQITDNVRTVEEFISSSGLPPLSFSLDAPTRFPVEPQHVEIHQARHAAMDAAEKVLDLLWEPEHRIVVQFHRFLEILPLQAIFRFKILKAIPLDGSASYEDIASQTGLQVVNLRRLLRLGMATGFLDETHDGRVCHNVLSALLLRKPFLNDVLGFAAEILFKSSTGLIDAIQADPSLQEPTAAGFNHVFQTDKHFLQYLDDNAKFATLFARTMKGMAEHPGFSHEYLAQGYDWEKLGKATVVDVGGSSGHACLPLARQFPSLDFVVQDLGNTIAAAQEALPEAAMLARFRFMAHDFLTPQPKIHNARVYLLRWILHDWPRASCLKIIKNLAMGMEPGSRIIIAESILPRRGELPSQEERYLAGQDLIMMLTFNGQERTLDEYKQLVVEADPRLRYVNHTQPANSSHTFIEFAFDDL